MELNMNKPHCRFIENGVNNTENKYQPQSGLNKNIPNQKFICLILINIDAHIQPIQGCLNLHIYYPPISLAVNHIEPFSGSG
jgi:hypothetical protein